MVLGPSSCVAALFALTAGLLGAFSLPCAAQTCVATQDAKILPSVAQAQFGTSVDIQGDRMIVGAPKEPSPFPGIRGVVHVFDRVGGVWNQTATLAEGFGGIFEGTPGFGSAVSLDGDQVAVGGGGLGYGPFSVSSDTAPSHGAVFVFVKQALGWAQEPAIVAKEQSLGLGFSVDIEGDVLLAGSPFPAPRCLEWVEAC